MRALALLTLGFALACTSATDGPGLTVGTNGQASVCGGDLAEQTFRYGLCVCGDLDMAGALRTSSLRASTGAPGLAGGVGVNGRYLSAGDAEIGGSLVALGDVSPVGAYDIAGELRVGGDVSAVGDIDVARDAYVQGRLRAIGLDVEGTLHTTSEQSGFFVSAGDTVVEDFAIEAPCGCDDEVPVADFIAQAALDNDNAAAGVDELKSIVGGAEIELPPGRYYFEELTAVGGFSFVLSGPTAIYVDDDLALAGALRIELATEEAELDLFVGGSILTAGYLRIGSQSRPSDVRVYVGGEGDIALAGALDLGGALYAPRARLVAAGDVELWGSVLVGEIADAGRIALVFDADLSDAGESCEGAPDDVEPVEPVEPVVPAEPVEPAGCAEVFDCPDPQVCVEGKCLLLEG